MEEENSKEMEVSYGVEKQSKKTKKKGSKRKTSKKTTQAKENVKEETPKKKVSLIDQIEEMKASGDVNSSEFREKMAKLEVILGIDEINPFGTNELDIFEDKLKGMNYADMKDMAYRVGISPFLPQPRMKAALIKEFRDSNKNNMRNIMPGAKESFKLDPNNPKHAKALEILGDI